MKRIQRFDHFLLFSTAALLASCGGGITGPKRGSIDTIISEERELVVSERTIATRICYAYQSKNTSFRTQSYLGGTFNFENETISCEGVKENYIIKSTLQVDSGGRLAFNAPLTNNKPFENQVQTTSIGYLTKLCSKIQTNQPISNTIDLDGYKVQIQFFKENLDGFDLRYFKKFGDSGYTIERSETFLVRTQFNSNNGQILGMDESFSRVSTCPNSKDKFSEFKQNFIDFSI